jgi:hypothetical protein
VTAYKYVQAALEALNRELVGKAGALRALEWQRLGLPLEGLAAVKVLALVRKLALPVLLNLFPSGGRRNGHGRRIPVALNGRHEVNGKAPP